MSADHTHEHDRGLSHDLPTLLSRRRALTMFGGAGIVAALAACAPDTTDTTDTTDTGTSSGSTPSSTPGEETGGSGSTRAPAPTRSRRRRPARTPATARTA